MPYAVVPVLPPFLVGRLPLGLSKPRGPAECNKVFRTCPAEIRAIRPLDRLQTELTDTWLASPASDCRSDMRVLAPTTVVASVAEEMSIDAVQVMLQNICISRGALTSSLPAIPAKK